MLKQCFSEVLRHHDICDRGTNSIEATRMKNLDVGLHRYTIKDTTGVGSITSISFKFAVRVWWKSKME